MRTENSGEFVWGHICPTMNRFSELVSGMTIHTRLQYKISHRRKFFYRLQFQVWALQKLITNYSTVLASHRINSVMIASRPVARARVPLEVDLIQLGPLRALQKPTGGVRGVAAGDIVPPLGRAHRHAATCPAAQPFQFAFTTKAGGEVHHARVAGHHTLGH